MSESMEHPFAPFVRILGKGQKGSRGLTEQEAYQAMGMLLDGQVEDTQLGAFLMLLRFKEETPEELAGFTRAVRERVTAPAIAVDLDWPAYAGKRRQLPWFMLAAKALANNGIRILMHGGGRHTAGRMYAEDVLDALAIRSCASWDEVATHVDSDNIAFIPLAVWMPRLQRMIDLRNTLGLRSPVHSLARLLNPLAARCGLQSIFHPGYQLVHQQANVILGDHALVIKGDGGEIEVRPEVTDQLLGATDGHAWSEEWPAQIGRQVKAPTLEIERLMAVWQGIEQDLYGENAILATMALALRGLGREREEAFSEAAKMWANRH
ncbi:glycosyl transferase family protein [Denitrificimonas caeni]|uniref:glycosyl transferase family protein n=1 Tax=Denitrificimonas caeni TaxID=521720 RepID=UPI0019666383|nr:glycosyl transferase family protein [Denitrificimonas caeni]